MALTNAISQTINGVTVSGTAANGNVLTASSASAASWQAPSGGTVAPKLRIYDDFGGDASGNLESRWTQVKATGGTLNTGTTGMNIGAGSTNTHSTANYRVLGGASFDGNLELISTHSDYVGAVDGYDQSLTIGNLTVNDSTGIVMTGKHIGWFATHNGGAVYKYSCADGTTQNSGTYTGTGNTNRCYVKKTGTSSIQYYYNGSLVGTLSANLPTGATQYPIAFAVVNWGAGSSQTMQCGTVEYTIEDH